MDKDNVVGYYRLREVAARKLAAATCDQQIRRIHSEMADRYAAKAQELAGAPRLKIVSKP